MIIPPRAIRLNVDPLADGKYHVEYEEDFEDAALVARTIAVAQACPVPGVVVENPEPHTIRVTIPEADLAQLSDMMVGEFMQWGTLGNMRLSEMILAGRA